MASFPCPPQTDDFSPLATFPFPPHTDDVTGCIQPDRAFGDGLRARTISVAKASLVGHFEPGSVQHA